MNALIQTLKSRFEKNMHRHKGMKWADVQAGLEANKGKMKVLQAMEDSGGEPDVVGLDPKTRSFMFVDCSPESPKGRRSLCYDREALNARKQHKPNNSAMDLATEMGATILNEEEYRNLQKLEAFDTKTSSWVLTPEPIRKLGGALFCDRRFDQVFTYHNGAESYYGARGFRAIIRI